MKQSISFPSGFTSLEDCWPKGNLHTTNYKLQLEWFSQLSKLEQVLCRPSNLVWGRTKTDILLDIVATNSYFEHGNGD
jgi:hypothetical protein